MQTKPQKKWPMILASALCALTVCADGYDIDITGPTNMLIFPESDEFASMIAGKAWDMTELYDITFRGRFFEPFTPPDNGIWSGVYHGTDLPAHYFPLFRGYTSNEDPDYLQYFTRTKPGTPYGPLNPINADYFNRLSIRHSLPADRRSSLGIDWNKTLSSRETNMFLFTDGDVTRTGTVFYPDGFRIYDIDMTGETFNDGRASYLSRPPQIQGTWADTIYNFYIIPSFPPPEYTHLLAGTEYAVDWIRLYHSDPSTRFNITWTNSDIYVDTEYVSVQLFVATNNINDEGDLLLAGMANTGTIEFHTGALPPGDYYLYLKLVFDVGDNFYELGRSDYSPLIRINARPTFEFTSPSFTSGVEYATSERGNPWDMSDWDDINMTFTANITNQKMQDGILSAQNTSDDPSIALSMNNPQGVHTPIIPAKYRYLTFSMAYDSSAYPSSSFASQDTRSWEIGPVARLQWADTDTGIDGSYTKDIILQEGWHQYTVDLWDNALLETRDYHLPNLGWLNTPQINYLILHPMEPSLPITFELDYIKICAPNTPANNIFPIRWVSGDADGDSLEITLLYGTGTGETFAGTEITTLSNQAPGTGEYQWQTHNLPPGEYTIRAMISDDLNTLVRDSLVPVIVSREGAIIRANGVGDPLDLARGDSLDITVEFHIGAMAPSNADWWAVAWDMTRNNWYYCVSPNVWEWFDGNLSQCRPAYRGPLQDLPPTHILSDFLPQDGTYRVYFAVDPMDGIINYPDGLFGFDFVTVNVN